MYSKQNHKLIVKPKTVRIGCKKMLTWPSDYGNKNFENSISSTYQQKDTIIGIDKINLESNSVDSDRFHKETPPLLVQPRQVELKIILDNL